MTRRMCRLRDVSFALVIFSSVLLMPNAAAQGAGSLLIRNIPGLMLAAGAVAYRCKDELGPCSLTVKVRSRLPNESPTDDHGNAVYCLAWIEKSNGTAVGDVFTQRNRPLQLILLDTDSPSTKGFRFDDYGLRFPHGDPDPDHVRRVFVTGNRTRAFWSGGNLVTSAGRGWDYEPLVVFVDNTSVTRRCHSKDPKIANDG